jgi:uncharacterized membrane protein HdeD (DUF308 family)
MSIERDEDQAQRALMAAVREHWVFYLIEGLILIVLGVIAIVIPPIASLAVTIFLGALFLVSGIVGLVLTLWLRHLPGFWWSLLSAALAIVTGILLLAWPVGGLLSLTLLLAAFFIIEGVATIMYALDHRRQYTGRWGWMLASGIVDLVLAALILSVFPASAAWALGLLVGINMLMGGSAMLAIALYARVNEQTAASHAGT